MFAIDFGARSIKVAKMIKTGNEYELDNFGAILSPEDSIANGEIINPIIVADVLRDMIRESDIRDRRAIVAITGQKVIIREIIMPLMDNKELLGSVMWEAPKYVPYDLDESIIDAKKVEEFKAKDGSMMMKILLVATPKSMVTPYMEVLKKVKLIPKVVDIVSSANIRAFSHELLNEKSGEKKDGILIDVILSIGASNTIFTLVEDGKLKFNRDILMGGNNITNAIAKSLNISFSEAEKLKRETAISADTGDKEKKINEAEKHILKVMNQITKEVRKSLSYYKTQSQKVKYNKMIVSGGCSKINNIDKMLEEQFEIPIIIGNPLDGIRINESRFDMNRIDNLKESLATVFGLAKRER